MVIKNFLLKLFIKNMVCIRCKMVVKDQLQKLGYHATMVELGEAEITEDLNAAELEQVRLVFLKSGLELMEDKKSILIQKIKNQKTRR